MAPARRVVMGCVAALTVMASVLLWTGCTRTPVGGWQAGGPSTSSGVEAIPGSFPSPAEELWIIARDSNAEGEPTEDAAGSGALIAETNEGTEVPLPLKHTDVRAEVLGYIATVRVTQQFHNPFDAKIEARYVFPLPHNAAVNEFVMTIGERRIRGIIRERQEAEQIYEQAKHQGYVASLLTQERPNVFSQSVANIEPGKEIDIELNYFHTLAWVDGWYEFVFPTVVGPRFNPPGSTAGIGAVPRGAQGGSEQATQVEYLKPGERSGHDIAIQLGVHAGVVIEETECASHVVTSEAPSPDRLRVALAPNDRIPNKDFVFRFRVAGSQLKTGLLTCHDERGGFFTLMLYPPKDRAPLARKPLELVFVLDSSGSMSGRPIAEAKQAIDRALRRLAPNDTFQLINFAMRASRLGAEPLPATPQNVRRGLDYLDQLEGAGGTMMIEGVNAALDFPHDPERLRFVCFLTDGYIGNEAQILSAIQEKLGASRIFSFGIGSSVNRYLLEHMAKVGRGAVAYLGPNDSAARIMDDFIERIRHPALTDVRLDWEGAAVTEVYPRRVPDLFVGRPVVLTGRFEGRALTRVRVLGDAAGQRMEWTVAAAEGAEEHRGLPSVWARLKIADLSDQALLDRNGEWASEIKQVALDYGLISEYTAFVAVDSSRTTAGSEGTTVPVAVPVPEGVKYRTSVPEK
ncbi:MAG: VWA domain-containing protein [Verrucomicrobia bacterium]|nr:VWA domain-containing protein [Verrucomicrobiota bacterium]